MQVYLSISLTSCDFIDGIFNKSKEDEIKEDEKKDEVEEEKQENKDDANNKENNLEEEKDDKIELDYRGLTGNSTFNNEYSLSLENDSNSYDITYELQNEDDSSFFSITKTDNSLVVKALQQNRFTYLNLVYKEKGKSTITKERKITLLSNTTDFHVSNFNENRLGEKNIDNTKYVVVDFDVSPGDNFRSSNRTNAIVVPSKVSFEDNIKKVGAYGGYSGDYFCRNIYLPSTVLHITPRSLGLLRCSGYLNFRKSKLGFYFYLFRLFYQDLLVIFY